MILGAAYLYEKTSQFIEQNYHTGAIFTTNSPKSTKSTRNPIARWSFQRNRYSSTCTAKSPFVVNRGFNYGSDRHSGVYY